MKHLILLILLTSQLISCSKITELLGEEEPVTNNSGGASPTQKDTVGENGNSNNNNNNNGNGGGHSILDNFISDANAGVIESENGCIDGFSKFTVYSNTESYHSCITSNPIINSNVFGDHIFSSSYLSYRSSSSDSSDGLRCNRQYGMSTCRWEQLKSASVQGVININNTPLLTSDLEIQISSDIFAPLVIFLSDTTTGGREYWTSNKSTITSAQEYCCYR